ncbi:MAG: hypothetical protein NTZ42_03410 [Candidatus Gribaldobacteria bacterium]|nr:hypothetical protein [Candidatus Gribaldobacteria bacterium]
MVKIIIAIFLFIVSCLPGCGGKKLCVDSFPGVDINEVICFNPNSGKVLWSCNLRQKYALPKIPNQYRCIGLGYFGNKEKAIIIFEHNSSKNLLVSSIARNISCECCKDLFLQGEVLKKFIQFKGLSAESPFSIID